MVIVIKIVLRQIICHCAGTQAIIENYAYVIHAEENVALKWLQFIAIKYILWSTIVPYIYIYIVLL